PRTQREPHSFPTRRSSDLSDSNIRGEVWFNELRLAEMDNRGGMAATMSMDTNFADFAVFSATGNMNTIGFGGIEDRPNQRSREEDRKSTRLNSSHVKISYA